MKVNDEMRIKIGQLYQQNLSPEKIGKLFGITKRTVMLQLVKMEVYQYDNKNYEKYKLTYDEIKIASEMIVNNYTIQEISEKIGKKTTWLINKLKRLGLYKSKWNKTSNIIKQNIVTDYKNGMLMSDIQIKYNVRPEYILKQAKVYKSKERYACNNDFFEKIDDEYKAYWLGFIAADGNVMAGSRNCLHIGLETSDGHHLEKFKQHINATNPIKHILYKSNKSKKQFYKLSKISIYNKKLIDDLNNHGIIPNKTKQLDWNNLTKNISDELIKHFIRGYFDGDGCWKIRKNQLSFSIGSASRMNFLENLQNWLCNTLNLNRNKIYIRKDKFKVLTYGGNICCKKLFNMMYDNSNVRLERKFDKSNGGLFKIT